MISNDFDQCELLVAQQKYFQISIWNELCLGNKNHFDNDIFYFGMQPFDITGEEMPTALTKLRKSKYGKYHDNHKFINETLVIMQCLCIYKAYFGQKCTYAIPDVGKGNMKM